MSFSLDYWLKSSARNGSAVEDGAVLKFGICSALKALLAIIGAGLGGLAAFIALKTMGGRDSPTVALIPLSVFALLSLSVPPSMVLDETGIRQCYWWGRSKQVQWGDVVVASYDSETGKTSILHKRGEIFFSPFLVGQKRFEKEVRAHIPSDSCLLKADDLKAD